MTRSTTDSLLYPQDSLCLYGPSHHGWGRSHLALALCRTHWCACGLQRTLVPLAKRSNNQIPFPDVLVAWLFYGLALGVEWFAHFTWYRRDPLLPQLLGLSRFPSPDPLRRFFLAFPCARLTTVSETVMRQSLECLPCFLLGHTLD